MELNDSEVRRQLQAPFLESEIEWRISRSGVTKSRVWAKILAYVTNRAIQNRLDDVFGPLGWQNTYQAGPSGGVMCGISVWTGTQWVTKLDGAANTEVIIDGKPDVDTNIKGGFSASMKRAAAQWGIGRYLYLLDEAFADIVDDGRLYGKVKGESGMQSFRWNPPRLPEWALPAGQKKEDPEKREPPSKAIAPVKAAILEPEVKAFKAPGPVTLKDIDAAYAKGKELGASEGTVRMAFAFATEGQGMKDGNIDIKSISRTQYDAVIGAMISKESLNAFLSSPKKAENSDPEMDIF